MVARAAAVVVRSDAEVFVLPVDQLVCRPEHPGEETKIHDLVARAFGDPIVADLVRALRASPDWIPGLSMVATSGKEIVGHIAFTRALLDAPRRLVDVLVLSPVSVAPEHQRRGVGSTLIRNGLDAVRSRAEPLLFLEGDPAYYSRFGFSPGGDAGFRRPSLRIPEPAFQVLAMPNYDSWMSGTLVYSRVFWDLDCVGLRDPDA
jgi:putative acetyltransferase